MRAQLRPLSSGTAAQPIVYQADGPVVIAAPEGTVGVMLTGVHDLVLRGLNVQAAAVQGVWVDDASRILIDRLTVANRAGVGVQIKRGTCGDDHAFAIDQQRARRPARHEPGARHGAARLARQRERPRRAALRRRRCGAEQHGRRGDGQHDHAQRRQRRLRARHLRRRLGRPLRDHGEHDRRQRRRRRQGRGRPRARGRQPAELGALRRRALGQSRARHGAVQPHPGPFPARRPADHRPRRPRVRGCGTTPCARPGARRRAAMPPRSSSPAPRNSICATTSSPTPTRTRSARRS